MKIFFITIIICLLSFKAKAQHNCHIIYDSYVFVYSGDDTLMFQEGVINKGKIPIMAMQIDSNIFKSALPIINTQDTTILLITSYGNKLTDIKIAFIKNKQTFIRNIKEKKYKKKNIYLNNIPQGSYKVECKYDYNPFEHNILIFVDAKLVTYCTYYNEYDGNNLSDFFSYFRNLNF
ncbi:hypothetical protein Fleli_0351 [Bernardetia litoralis DSM 6794]|uniref:Uncharacterized protein n=1 Tax=Bernardetia litoralis (strain ATCC 23117 / DSM 6794 / NBRC 15988 / NCIMB 1366 / Fx l1 / Sio-4) TaxID=880071 RepID=I4AFU7_BERLS|nr:hypothetical protein [Bernardetia litoralis]AFM02832.1 hypothetical protein Fleli_0351 [Bernardetia litoralis DSM 6794]